MRAVWRTTGMSTNETEGSGGLPPDEESIGTSRRTLTVPEAAEVLGISRAQAYACARSGALPTMRFGRRLVVSARALAEMLGEA